MSRQVASKLVQPPAGTSHFLRAPCVIEGKQLSTKLLSMLRLNSSLGAGLEKPLDTLVPE